MANFQMWFTQNGTCVALDVVAPSPSINEYISRDFFHQEVFQPTLIPIISLSATEEGEEEEEEVEEEEEEEEEEGEEEEKKKKKKKKKKFVS